MKAFSSFLTLALLIQATTPIAAATPKLLCKPPMQIRVDKHNVSVSSAGQVRLESGVSYPNGSYWEEGDVFVLCPCKEGRCIAKCSNLFQEDGEHYSFRDDQLNFQLKIEDKSGVSSVVVFNEHFHVFEEGLKWVPYYYLSFEASIDATKLEKNAPLLWNETAADKVCFLIDKQKILILEAPVENYREVYQLFIIWTLNALFLSLLVIALYKAGDSKTIYGKCLIRHAFSMMMANLGIFLCTQLYLLGAVLPAWFCYCLGFMTYYFEMCLLFWLTCLLHGICITFSSAQMEITKGSTRRCTVYKWISWGLPLIMTILLFVTVFIVNKTYSLHSGILFNQFNKFKYRYNCFITKWELTYFMFKLLPEISFVSINSIFFVKTAFGIYKAQSEIQKVLKNKTAMQLKCYSFSVFLKLFLLMGVTRIVEIIFWFIFHRQRNLFTVILQALGSLQSLWLVIFCVVTKEKVRAVFKTWLQIVFFCCKCESNNGNNSAEPEESVSFKSKFSK